MAQFGYLKLLPRNGRMISIPISSLFYELEEYQNICMVGNIGLVLPIEKKHKEAADRICRTLNYLAIISYRLIKSKKDDLYSRKNLDWESLIIFLQIILDSVAILIPLFYGKDDRFFSIDVCSCCKSEHEFRVSSFNNIHQWLETNKISDEFSRYYKNIRRKKYWYGQIKNQRKDFIHSSKTQNFVPLILKNATKLEVNYPYLPINEKFLEKEVKNIFKNLLNFLAFCEIFFKKNLKERNIIITDSFRVCTSGDEISFLNKLIR